MNVSIPVKRLGSHSSGIAYSSTNTDICAYQDQVLAKSVHLQSEGPRLVCPHVMWKCVMFGVGGVGD